MAPDNRQELVQGEAPELQALLLNLKSSLEEVRSRIGPLVNEVCSSTCPLKAHPCVGVADKL